MLLAVCQHTPAQPVWPPAVDDRPELGATPIDYLPALAGDYFKHESLVVGRRYHIFVRLPEGYTDAPERTYPIVYLLDGDSTFPMLAPQHLFLHYDEKLPEAIVVGVAYGGLDPSINKRHIDFRPTLVDGSERGARAFLTMLEEELLPRVERRFRADGTQRVLVRQSRGGSFVHYAAHHRPELFHGFIASNPGREWGDELIYGMSKPMPEVRTNNHMILASGSRDRDYLRGAALEWRDEMAGRDDLPWQATFLDIEGGTHAASLPDVYRRAMLIYSNLKASHQRIRAAVDIAASPIQIAITTAPATRDTGRAATKFAFIRNSARCSLSSTFSTNHTPSCTIRKSSTNPKAGMKSGIKSTGLKA